MGARSGTSREEFEPSSTTRNVLAWAQAAGASTLGDALELLDVLAISNDVPEVLGESGDLDVVRAELEDGIELVGVDQDIDAVL
jgi:hypothetical protein